MLSVIQQVIRQESKSDQITVCSRFSILKNFLNKEECRMLITGFEDNEKTSGEIEQIDYVLRKSHRLAFHSKDLANWMWKRLSPVLSYSHTTDEFGDKWEATHLNDYFRVCRYEQGGKFAKHEDGVYHESPTVKSFATLMVYLNTIPTDQGGSTYFMHYGMRVHPIEGNAVCFLVDNLVHEGEELKEGVKYILRTDVMYTAISQKDVNKSMEIFNLRNGALRYEDEDNEEEANKLWQQVADLEISLKKD